MSEASSEHDDAGQVAAFFDVDHTLLACNSARKWVEYLWRHDQISVAAALRSAWWLVKYRLSVLDYEQVTADVVRAYAGRKEAELCAEVAAWFHSDVEAEICVEGRERVEWHRQQGHQLVMLTSGTHFSVEPLRQILEIPHLVCTEIEVVDGVLTGKHISPSCFGPGKRLAAVAFAGKYGIDLARSYFYTDSYSDLPMLERVGEPRVINPDPRLRRWALHHHRPFEIWHAQGPNPREATQAQVRAHFLAGLQAAKAKAAEAQP